MKDMIMWEVMGYGYRKDNRVCMVPIAGDG